MKFVGFDGRERRSESLNYQILWLVLLIAFAGIEGITAGLVSIWFCAGSLVALIATWLGASFRVQIGLFAVVSVAAWRSSVPWPENGCIPRWKRPTRTAFWARRAWWWNP